jgi:hypothetical protein
MTDEITYLLFSFARISQLRFACFIDCNIYYDTDKCVMPTKYRITDKVVTYTFQKP